MNGERGITQLEAALKNELLQLDASGKIRELPISHPGSPGRIESRGRELIDLTNWDFLSLAQNSEYRDALPRAVSNQGFGGRSPRSLSGTSFLHSEFERRFALFMGTESSLLFSSKNQAVLSLLTALVSENDLVLADEMVQSPIADAAYLVGARHLSIQQSRAESIATALEREPTTGRRFIYVEALSPLTGERTPLEQILTLAAQFDLIPIVDESFTLVAYGARGSGTLESSPLRNSVLAWICDLSRGLCGIGTSIATSSIVAGFLLQRSRTFHYETALPSPLLSLNLRALDLIELNAVWRERLRLASSQLRLALTQLRLSDGLELDSPVIVVPEKNYETAKTLQRELLSRGFLVDLLSPLAARNERAAIRIVVTTALEQRDLNLLTAALSELTQRLKTR